jgi:hypothetical protein
MDMTITLKDLLSPLTTIVAASGATLGVILTMIANRRNLQNRQAFDSYQEYLKDCLAEPMLASGDVKIPKNYEADWTKEFYKYQWVVARFLGASEDILELSSRADREDWQKAITGDARWHAKYFSSEIFERVEFEMCSPKMQEIIIQVATPEAQKRLRGWIRK